MTDAPISRRGGMFLGIAGILLIAATLRLPVGALSPLGAFIDADIALSATALGVLGMLPPIGFAVAGLTAPGVAHRIGLERTLLIAIGVMIAGHLLRAAAPDFVVLTLGSLLLLLGAGFGNVLLPSAVKRFTPGAIGPMTAAYATIMSIGSALPPLLAVPIAESADWRLSLASWGFVVIVALVPWIMLAVRAARTASAARSAAARGEAADDITEPDAHRFAQLARSRTVWGITIPFAVSGISAYATFALLPVMLQDLAGVSAAVAGSLLALFAILGMPLALVTPVLTARLRTPTPILLASMGLFGLGYGGLLVAPALATPVWVAAIALGQVMFPMCLALFSLRTASATNAANVSGFVQTVGYAVAAVSPLALGALHEVTGSWAPSLIVLLAVIALTVFAIPLLARGDRVEDDLGGALS
ncbi:MAG: MFS transporter [Microcella sp.]|nr:MFS transporter [Microcella sp.]